MMKKILCMLLCLAMTASMLTMVAAAATTSVLEYNTPVVNDTYELEYETAPVLKAGENGANGLAKNGYNYEEILHFFYNNIEVVNMQKSRQE